MTLVPQVRRFWISAKGQDMIEYSILLGFVFLVCMCFFLADTAAVRNIWKSADTTLNKADSTKRK
jgi:Flp pilus assembly pilin Flp